MFILFLKIKNKYNVNYICKYINKFLLYFLFTYDLGLYLLDSIIKWFLDLFLFLNSTSIL